MRFKIFEDVVKFHGHSCPGLAIGFKVAIAALEELNLEPAYDEEIVCIVENDSCAVDAIQVITGCTFGKGNLIFKDYGKHVYTFFDRKKELVVRISSYYEFKEKEEEKSIWQKFIQGEKSPEIMEFIHKRKAEKIKDILNAKKEDFLKITYPKIPFPHKARIFKNIRCENCKEKVSEIKARLFDGKIFCIPCFEALL